MTTNPAALLRALRLTGATLAVAAGIAGFAGVAGTVGDGPATPPAVGLDLAHVEAPAADLP